MKQIFLLLFAAMYVQAATVTGNVHQMARKNLTLNKVRVVASLANCTARTQTFSTSITSEGNLTVTIPEDTIDTCSSPQLDLTIFQDSRIGSPVLGSTEITSRVYVNRIEIVKDGTVVITPDTVSASSGPQYAHNISEIEGLQAALNTGNIIKQDSTPSTCSVGALWFKTNASAGHNLFLCSATNQWTEVTGLSSGDLSNITGIINATSATRTSPVRVGTSDPGTCVNNEFFYNSTSRELKVCYGTNQWKTIGSTISNLTDITTRSYADLQNIPSTFTPSTHSHAQSDITGLASALTGKEPANSNIQAHISSTSNPHSVTKSQVGLGNVPNTDATSRANHTGSQLAATISDFATAGNLLWQPLNTGLTTLSGKTLVGNGTNLRFSTGAITPGNALTIDVSGNIIDAGSTPGGGGGGTGTVTSIALSLPSWLSVSGSPITTSGTFAVTAPSASAALVLATPGGSSGAPALISLTAAHIPTLTSSKISDFSTSALSATASAYAGATHSHAQSDVTGLASALTGKEPANANIQAHISSTANPHSVTKSQVGLGSVDNTADSAKNVATAAALAANGTNCASGEASRGIDAAGNAEGCFVAGVPTFSSTDNSILVGVNQGVVNLTAGSNTALLDANNNFTGSTANSTSATQTISGSSSRILANATKVSISCTSAITLTGANIIADSARDGQELTIFNAGTNDCTLTSGTTENLKLPAATVTITPKQHYRMIYDLAASIWSGQVDNNTGGGGGGGTSIGTALQKGDGSGGFLAAVSGTDYDLPKQVAKVIGKGGSTTTYSTSAEASAGVAPNVNTTFGAVSTGDVIQCRWSIHKQDVSANGTAAMLRASVFINNVYAGGAQEFNPTTTGLAAGQMVSATILVNSTSSVTTLVEGRQFNNNQAIVPEFFVGPRSISLTSSNTIEIRPYIISGAGDDTFSVNSWVCTLSGPNQ